MVTEEEVLAALKNVVDPELGINVVDLGLIYDVKVKEGDVVHVKMTLTVPTCPLYALFTKQVEEAVKKAGAKEVEVELTFDPPWTPDRMSPEAKKILGLE